MRGHYFALQPKLLNKSSNVKINISEYLGESNSPSIEIEPNNNDDNSIIPYNDISLYHTNVSEKELILILYHLIILIILIKLIS
jgi:hypothetical protein